MKRFRISIFADGRLRYKAFRSSIENAKAFVAETIPERLETGRVVISVFDHVDHSQENEALGWGMANAANPYIASIYYNAIYANLCDDKDERLVESYDISDEQ